MALLPNGTICPEPGADAPNAGADDPKPGVWPKPDCGADPKAGVLTEGKLKALLDAAVLEPKPKPPDEAPNAGAVPNAGLLVAPKAGVLFAPNAGVLEPNAGVLDPKAEVLVPKAEVLPKLKELPLDAPKDGVLPPNIERFAA